MLKIASMVGTPDLETPTLAPYRGELTTAFQMLSGLGYDGVELMTKHPTLLDGAKLRDLLEEHKLTLTGLCSGHVFGEDKLGLVMPDLTINPEAVSRLKEFIDFAGEWCDPGTMVNIGRSRGVGDPARPEASLETYCQAFQELSDYALPKKVRLILEPVSRKEVNFIHSTLDGLQMARMVDRPNFGIMPDTYHMWNEDEDMFQSFYDAAPYIWHVHFSDSNRCYPGSGEIDFYKVMKVLEEIGYGGFVSMEIQPYPDADASAKNSLDHIRRYQSSGV